ncbi:BZ3500_MvSof-1268-A1-R1_Chr6-3g08822 [Microbotryum saponariae]|uniref:BZ3500_MvSof-1268-A1-R1_Chr6-3g08822 protein n=1 Tax=Microbotryum saponariae TaxID=289078 RepID=A0A2X0KNV8_9BASI|nr:BZ3500_MvSof-1268-A1-R1_Chr6-3g08822 [Microbotryum saponariae]SDA07423.1 BZ3501_MvSof-1269-A2-R1_Chr6-2g08525 [Microbotryum saponariae]
MHLSLPNHSVQNNPHIYLAVYSSVPVYEMMVRGIGVMRRRADSYLNATQILKVAGVPKGNRTKILEKDIALGVHEKVQGGYGRYQGTWIPYHRARELSDEHGVTHLLVPLFDYVPPPGYDSLGAAGPSASSASASAPVHRQTANVAAAAQSSPGALSSPASRRQQETMSETSESAPPSIRKRASARASIVSDENKRPRREAAASTSQANGHAPRPVDVFANNPEEQWKLRSSSAPLSNQALAEDPSRTDRNRSTLKSIFAMEPENSLVVPNLASRFPADVDPDTPIDENMHTALHWAAALARITIAKALVNFGADVFRGNNVGETALIRAVLVTNNCDQDTFPALLEVLGPSLRTIDESGRTVLHHAALVAGVKGRASSARYYLESVLEYVARVEGGRFQDLVDAQDNHGDTALNIAARIGNRSLVRALIDVGADKRKANNLGLRPGDFGLDGVGLERTEGELAIESLRSTPSTNKNAASSAPTRASNELLQNLTTMIKSLEADFKTELRSKAEDFQATQTHLHSVTKELQAQRRELDQWQQKAAALDAQHARIRNLKRAIHEEDHFDWTGRTEIDGSPAIVAAGPSFTYRGPMSVQLPNSSNVEFDADPKLPAPGSERELIHLIRLQGWYKRVLGLLDNRLSRLEGGEIELENELQRIVAKVCGVDVDKVDTMFETLFAALESDGSMMDQARIAGFLSKVKDGSFVQ